jgi:ABC-2 type transport system permease protein
MSVGMLADSVFSEAYRLTRNRMAVFWSVFFVPILFTVGGIAYHLITKAKTAELAAKANIPATMGHDPVNLGDALSLGAGMGANGAILVFMLIGAATLYAGDYRWETWRLISARNSRINLILGKVAVMKLMALAAMLAFLIAAIVFTLAQAVIFERPLSFEFDGGDAGRFLLLWLLSWVRIVQYVMLALLTATLTRSLLAALFVPWVVGFAQSLLGGPGLAILGWEPTEWLPQQLLPGLAFETIKTAIEPAAPGVIAPDGLLLKAFVSLALWTLAPLIGAIAWFQRQDLSKE